MAKIKLKGILPIGGYPTKYIERVYRERNISNIKITGEPIVQVTASSTGGNCNITFKPNAIKNFIDGLGDSEYTTSRKVKAIADIGNIINQSAVQESQAQQNIVKSSPKSAPKTLEAELNDFNTWLYSDGIEKLYGASIALKIKTIWESAIQSSLFNSKITFIIKDTDSVIRATTITMQKHEINANSEAIYIPMNDSLSASKDGFNGGENISIFLREDNPDGSIEYILTYQSAPITAVADGIRLIDNIQYNDNKTYNSLLK